MIEYMAVFLILGGAVFFVAHHFWKIVRGKSSGCGKCSMENHCGLKELENKHC